MDVRNWHPTQSYSNILYTSKKLLWEVIQWSRVHYHRCAKDTQFYSNSGLLWRTVEVLSCYLEALRTGWERTDLNLILAKQLPLFASWGTTLLSPQDEVAVPMKEQKCNWRAFLVLQWRSQRKGSSPSFRQSSNELLALRLSMQCLEKKIQRRSVEL